jgi:hypothetical protein
MAAAAISPAGCAATHGCGTSRSSCAPERTPCGAEIGVWAPVVSKPFDIHQVERLLADAASTRDRASERGTGFERAG